MYMSQPSKRPTLHPGLTPWMNVLLFSLWSETLSSVALKKPASRQRLAPSFLQFKTSYILRLKGLEACDEGDISPLPVRKQWGWIDPKWSCEWWWGRESRERRKCERKQGPTMRSLEGPRRAMQIQQQLVIFKKFFFKKMFHLFRTSLLWVAVVGNRSKGK